MYEKSKLYGRVTIEVRDIDGVLKDSRQIDNTIMNTGKASVAGLILSDIGGTAYDYIAIGTSNTAPNATQTALVGEVYRTSGAGSLVTTSVANDTAYLSGSFNITSSVSLQEAGMFNSSSGGTMLARTTYSSVALNSGDTINTVWQIQIS